VLQLFLDYEEFKPVEELWDRLSAVDGNGTYRRFDVSLLCMLTGYRLLNNCAVCQ
jgi:hypothetical protein